MKLATSSVPLDKVRPTASRWNFSATDLETAAQLALHIEGVINPIVVRREQGFNTYAILDGNFEYYAMAYAHQMDARRCLSIEAIVVEPRDEPCIQKQIALFRGRFPDAARPYLDSASHFKEAIPPLHADQTTPFSLVEVFNAADHMTLLNQLKRIGVMGKTAEKLVETIEQERQQYAFTSLKDIVLRVKGLTYEKMIALLEAQ
jgi:ParB family chromosome partitioning protein